MAGLLKLSRRLSGFGPVGCRCRSLSHWQCCLPWDVPHHAVTADGPRVLRHVPPYAVLRRGGALNPRNHERTRKQLREKKKSLGFIPPPRAISGDLTNQLSNLSSHKVFSPKSIPTQIRQLDLYTSNSKGPADDFGEELTSAQRL